ncbi:MAG: PIN domain-containing protein [Candidatus Omnitrophica bacterium]|nr:PIN domain-containing protein [Candidatus Omnitrophota bacterium]
MKNGELLALDTNILVYADDPSSANHLKAREYLEGAVKGSLRTCLSHQILAEYFSVVTSEKKVKQPLAVEEAKERVIFLNQLRAIKKIYPKRSTFKRSVEFCAKHGIRGIGIFDAVYAVTLLDNRVKKLVTRNASDFKPFRELGLEVIDPFV